MVSSGVSSEWSPLSFSQKALKNEEREGGGGGQQIFLLPGLTLCDLSDPGGISQTCSLLFRASGN